MKTIDVQINDIYLPHLNNRFKTQIFFGGSSSGKSFFLAQRAVIENIEGANYLIVRKVGATIKKSIFNEVKKAIYSMGVEGMYKINESELTMTNIRNNKQIIFSGLDSVEKLKSITPIKGVIEKILIEEATEIKREDFLQLKKRLRGESGIKKSITLAFNPILRDHWIFKEFFKDWNDRSKQRVNVTKSISILKTTYKDNRFLTQDDIDDLEGEQDPYFYNVYTLGNFGVLGSVIYRNWRIDDLTELRAKADNVYCGLDFGYTNPTAFVRCHVDEDRRKIYVLDELYLRGAEYEPIAEAVIPLAMDDYVNCDSEEKRGIFMLQKLGVNAIATKKGAGSVNAGIKHLQGYEIIVDERCQHFINEITQYHWAEDSKGNKLERPVKDKDHLMDALRYAVEPIMLIAKTITGVKRI